MNESLSARQQELALHFADRMAAEVVEVFHSSEWLAAAPADPDDPEAPGHYWKYLAFAVHPGREVSTDGKDDFTRAFEYLKGRGLILSFPGRDDLFRVAELPPDPPVFATQVAEAPAPPTEPDETMRKLERSLAYESAVGTLDGSCLIHTEGEDRWLDTGFPDTFSEEEVKDAAQYLEWRGLLERHSTKATLVQIRDEGEEQGAGQR